MGRSLRSSIIRRRSDRANSWHGNFRSVYWLESNGYDVTYCSNSDMLDPKQPLRAKVFLSVGHDEYWDPRQYETALAAVKAGVTELYLCGNSVFGVAPFSQSYDGRPNRIISRKGRFGGPTQAEMAESFKYPFPMTALRARVC